VVAIVYTAPDTHILGAGLIFGDFELADNANADHFGRIVSGINGVALGSIKAAVTNGGTASRVGTR